MGKEEEACKKWWGDQPSMVRAYYKDVQSGLLAAFVGGWRASEQVDNPPETWNTEGSFDPMGQEE